VSLATAPFSCPWDSGQFGVIYTTVDKLANLGLADKSVEEVKQMLADEVKFFSAYLNGDCYCYEVEDENGEVIDSCCGFYNFNECQQAGQSALDAITNGSVISGPEFSVEVK
jgi:hypothetical protein